LLALPCAVAGLGVAIFHEYLEQIGKLECPAGVFGVGSAPQQSLAVLLLLTIILALPSFTGGGNGRMNLLATCSAIVLGVLFAVAAVKSAPPPVIPEKAYKLPVNEDGCRPPYRSQSQ
jgi:hypothetical protein